VTLVQKHRKHLLTLGLLVLVAAIARQPADVLRQRNSPGVSSSGSPGLAIVTHPSTIITTAVAEYAAQISREVLAKSFLARTSARLFGT
jgi:hypothetical protein